MLEPVNDSGPSASRVRLDREGIIDTVMKVAREEPQTRITMKRVGEELGVDGSAIYRHFRDREALTEAATDRLIGWGAEEAHASTGTWRERLEAHLIRLGELCLQHPSIAAETLNFDSVGPGGISAMEFILETLSQAGLTDEALVDGYAAVSGFALSQGALLASDALKGDGRPIDGSAAWIVNFGAVNISKYPFVRQHLDALLAIDGMSVYRSGANKLLDSISATVNGT